MLENMARQFRTRMPALVPTILLGLAAMLHPIGFAAAEKWPSGPFLQSTEHTCRPSLKAFPKWLAVRERYAKQTEVIESDVMSRLMDISFLDGWHDRIKRLSGRERMDQLREVNAFFNEKPYVDDVSAAGTKDDWKTPYEFLRESGDSEDYAIAKFFMLRELGVGNDDIRIVVVQDLELRIPHAILAVRVDQVIWALDNQLAAVIPVDKIQHYSAIFSVNETGWCRYKGRRTKRSTGRRKSSD
jgi:predicted transglutaminase-like cysteine proteinase